jgi:hypothetical protein
MTIKDNWNKPPLIPHKLILKALVLAWCFMAIVLTTIGVGFFASAVVPALILVFAYFAARLLP